MTAEIHKIPAGNLDRLNAEIAELNKKAAKLGCTPATVTVHGEEVVANENIVTGIKSYRTYLLVSVTGETPKLAGWRLVAAIEAQDSGENLVSCVPGQTVPVAYRTRGNECDHCGKSRRRTEVFIVGHDDGRFAQVGRNCLADFLGGKFPAGLLAAAGWIGDLESCVRDAEDEFYSAGGPSWERTFGTDEFLKTTAAVIRKLGWVSRTAAGPDGGDATVGHVTWLLSPSYSANEREEKKAFVRKFGIELDERDAKLATDALAWGIALPTDEGDYLYNLGVACRLGFVRVKTAGLMASLIAAYQRHLNREQEVKVERETRVNEYFGTIGERIGFVVTVKSIRSFDSAYGVRTMIRCLDTEGHTIVWWKSGDTEWEEGETLEITATIKKHEEYKGYKQTIVSRATKGIKKPKGKRKAA